MNKTLQNIFIIGGTVLAMYVGYFLADGWFSAKYETPTAFRDTKPLITVVDPKGISETKMWNTVQEWRVSTSREEYIKDETLCELASSRVEEIRTEWSHSGFYKSSDKIVFNKTNKFKELGENLAKQFRSEPSVLKGWLDSPTHRDNLEYGFKYSCIKTDGDNVVHIFGR